MNGATPTLRRLPWLLIVLALLVPGRAGLADDAVLFSTTVAPNVLIVADNSGSMEHIVWHPDFDPNDPASWGCNHFPTSGHVTLSGPASGTICGNSRTVFVDPETQETRWDHRYLNWYFGLDETDPEDAAILAELAATDNGQTSECLNEGTFSKFRRSRITALKQVIREVICNVNEAGEVRFGLAQFRQTLDGDPEGGFVVVPVDDWSQAQDQALEDTIDDLRPEAWTPLGETLFQLYTYFMSRGSDSDRPLGADGSTRFPPYLYGTNVAALGGGDVTNNPPPSPVECDCQRNFVIVITDGEPTMDDFREDTGNEVNDLGFDDFQDLIGDYASNDFEPSSGIAPAGNDEEGCAGGDTPRCGYYLDDIAKFMQDTDFRPDMPGDQVIDVYTIGFSTTDVANELLESAAEEGNGLFRSSNDAGELAAALIEAITDIIEKSQAFTSATVPATRTAQGGNFYSSFFIPSAKDPFWEGHIQNFTITSQGQILDQNGVCALDDPSGNCLSGRFLGNADPHWDAADAMPDPASRTLEVSRGGAKVPFDRSTLGAADLDVTYPPPLTYPDSDASSAEQLADEIVDFLRGCEFGTELGSDCQERQRTGGEPKTLGDVFHSNPVVVGPPSTAINEPSFLAFATTRPGNDNQPLGKRDRVLIAGANDGFLHGFDAGSFDNGAFTRGSGTEIFGFMPWWVRRTIKNLPLDLGNRDYYFVDGSPAVADVWLYDDHRDADLTDSGSTKASDGSEWATVAVGGLRQGGPVYYALDITDPSSTSYPGYLWEFPAEGDTSHLGDPNQRYIDYMGETWSDPVIARVKVSVNGSTGLHERWVAIFGAGYHPSGDPNSVGYDATNDEDTSRKGRGLFMVDIKSGRVLGARVYHHVTTPWGGTPAMQYALASPPAVVDLDFDGFADAVYIGDLGGNLWKWVIHPSGEDTINPINAGQDFRTDKSQPTWEFGKIFSAPSATIGGNEFFKSFFLAPALTFFRGELWLAAGTGERADPAFEGADPNGDADNNRFYAIKDTNMFGLPDADPMTGSREVIQQSDLPDITDLEGCVSPGNLGYQIVAREGEKFVTSVEIIGFFVFAGSFIPNPSTGTCAGCDSGGDATLYTFKIYCGEGFFPQKTGADQRRLDLGPGMPTDARLSLGEENRIYMMTSENELKTPPPPPLPDGEQGILYWREVRE